ncbi:DUF7319 domain-containing protein [Haloparvum sp. PAK95]|uniref:DUF7319 domain-containing protein n=1 Tax=Haloparvum sp. PAK95 TaxID=3418962 RepID=UPI003D2F4799
MNDSADDSVGDADEAASDGPGVATEDSDQARGAEATADADATEDAPTEPVSDDPAETPEEPDDLEALREKVEETYDFDEFGPSDMAQMSAQEWDAAFDPDTWITGEELLDRVADELKSRIATRDVFGVLERVEEDGEPRVVVYSDEGYAIVHPTGQVRGQGTVLRDVEPIVALCSMDSYDVPEPPDDWSLPDPESVPQGTGEFGNLMLQVVAGAQLVGGVALIGAWILLGVETIVAPVMGLLFLVAGLFLFSTVANARLSDRFRSEEYRERLRALRAAEERPEFVPIEEEAESVERDGR